MTDEPNTPQMVLDAVRARFLDRLGDRCLEIEALMLTIDERGQDQALLQEISSHVHKIAGIAPTLGFTNLGKAALEMEMRLSQDVTFFDWQACRQQIEDLLDLMEDALDAPPV